MSFITVGTTIDKQMTRSPLRIEITTTLSQAIEIMNKAKIRHLPVVKARKLVGIICWSELNALLTYCDINIKDLTVEKIMDTKVNRVSSRESLSKVVVQMAKWKSNYVVVTERDEVVGIFTEIDAFRIIHDTCRRTSKYTSESKCDEDIEIDKIFNR